MITRLSLFSSGILAMCLVLFAAVGPAQTLAAGDTVYQVQLIWGTNGEKPKDSHLKDVDPKLQEKLKGVFKWKNYFEVNSKPLTIPKEGAKRLKLSDKCEIEVEEIGRASCRERV